MSFRIRQTILTALAVAAAIAVASALVYVLVRGELRDQVDDSLRNQAAVATRAPLEIRRDRETGEPRLQVRRRGGPGFEPGVFAQVVNEDGTVVRANLSVVAFPVTEETLAVARGERGETLADAEVEGVDVRMLTVPLDDGYALQLVRPLDEVDSLLGRVGLIMVFVALGGIVVAALLGWAVARSALRPVRRLTREAELVTETRDLAHRIDVHGTDELARLGSTFNSMLAALGRSQEAQRQLVADASHELRTPLTSLRTNIEVLARNPDLPQREALLADLTGQLEEMSSLVANLVELAADRPVEVEPTEVQLDELVQDAVERARRLSPQVAISTDLRPTLVRGVPYRLERAVANVLDNAVKWSPPGGTIEVRVADGEVVVRDHGPGIDEDDLPHVFDRFYRSPAARALPGSGLGLSIVKQVVDEHGGSVALEAAEGGGTRVRLRFALVPEDAPPPA